MVVCLIPCLPGHWALVALWVTVVQEWKCVFVHWHVPVCVYIYWGHMAMCLRPWLRAAAHHTLTHHYLGQDHYAGSHSGDYFASRHSQMPKARNKCNFPKFWFPDLSVFREQIRGVWGSGGACLCNTNQQTAEKPQRVCFSVQSLA